MKEADYYKCYKRLLTKRHLQVAGLNGIPLLSYLPKYFMKFIELSIRDAMLVPMRMDTNMVSGNQRNIWYSLLL